MELELLFVCGRSAAVQLEDGGLYHTVRPYRLVLNGEEAGVMDTVVRNLFGLWPDREYTLAAYDGDTRVAQLFFRTEAETFSLNVRRFGAVGDGEHDDTAAIQTAIYSCPAGGRVLIPAGRYRVKPLLLKSHIRLELARSARLELERDRSLFPILPGATESTDETRDLYLGTWEGNQLDMFAALLTGIDVEDVVICGEGVCDGMAQQSDWWVNPKVRRGAYRGRLLFLCRCRNIVVQGVPFCNSPAWNLHPYFSETLRFLGITVNAPANSPNTDGFDPESCRDILLAGAHFSLGDDCIAIKSGKLYMGAKFAKPCENIEIAHCLMENGHGGVTVGSEVAGGVRNVRVHDCLMRHTDRGLRVKTRRGRGKDGVLDGIVFDNVVMDTVGTPFVVNCLYFCDPDGHSAYVQSREAMPVDERTPRVGRIAFRHVTATGAACAGYFLGLPEQPIAEVRMEDVRIACDPDAAPMQPAMADCVPRVNRTGIVASDVASMVLKNVTLTGCEGESLCLTRVCCTEEQDADAPFRG